jgi:16S rRNA processing protein RimM
MAVVGRIARPHGIRGQVIVNVETDFPEARFQPGVELFINRSAAIDRITLTAVRFQNGRPIVGIAGVDSVDAARDLAGAELRVPSERLVDLPAGTFYRHDLIGCKIETTDGRQLGAVTDVEGPLESSRLVVNSGKDEILIPFAAEICVAVDATGKRIVIAPPEGLLSLNQEPQRAEPRRAESQRAQGAQTEHRRVP